MKKKYVEVQIPQSNGKIYTRYYTLLKEKPEIGSIFNDNTVVGFRNVNRNVKKYSPDLADKYYFYDVLHPSLFGFNCKSMIAIPKHG